MESDLQECDQSRLLIVDDEEPIRNLFMAIVSYDLPDLKIDLAANGLEAVTKFTQNRHATILMDLRMPVMDGLKAFETIKRTCEEHKWQMPSIVFCTGFAPPQTVQQLVSDDPRHCMLLKPVSSDKLVNAVASRIKT